MRRWIRCDVTTDSGSPTLIDILLHRGLHIPRDWKKGLGVPRPLPSSGKRKKKSVEALLAASDGQGHHTSRGTFSSESCQEFRVALRVLLAIWERNRM